MELNDPSRRSIPAIEQQDEFCKNLKISILKQLQQKGKLTGGQLNLLIRVQNDRPTRIHEATAVTAWETK